RMVRETSTARSRAVREPVLLFCCIQPFREQPECADEAEKPAPERRFEAITPDEKHPCDGDPCRQPVIENCFARHPDQIWRQQHQDAGPSRSDRGYEVAA